ncbi:MAG: GGDEF domain-containing protein [Anaerolineales bacterium]
MTVSSSPPQTRRMRKAFFLLLSIGLALLLGWIDYRTESEIVLSIFYLLPIGIAAWYVHETAGGAVSILSAAFAAYDTELQSGALAGNIWPGAWATVSRLAFFLITVWLLGRQRRTMDSIRRMAMTDSLTGAYNTRTFFDMLQKEMARSRRYNRPLSLIYLDIDNFKKVNDSHGHQMGNSVLAAVAAALRESVRRMDIVARVGGDEFSILLPEVDETAARSTVGRVQENLGRETAQKGCGVTVSLGAVTYRTMDYTADDIIRTADDLMYRVKRGGKNGALFAVVPE